jgi:predicted glutamine amidotransferase
MCRWMAWHGQPVLIEELLFKTQHGIVDQSLHSRMGAEPTNGDGFGVGWYGAGEGPGVYHSVAPAWGDANLRELAGHVASPLFLVHVRAAIGSPIQQTNCHPFRHGRWLFVHNGYVGDFHVIRRDLMWAIDPKLCSNTSRSVLRFRGPPSRRRRQRLEIESEAHSDEFKRPRGNVHDRWSR